ncbi:MAG TPA: CpsB/CapC family capsule biosynthesis tyrosine phosphatase [Syntrophorhabdaceae bacterium]|jgi:protein-tyrosine phosphatase
MTDIHVHVLPALDDGPDNMDDAIAMCAMAADDGIDTMVATPHMGNGTYENSKEIVFENVNQLNTELSARNIHLRVLPGADNHVSEQLDKLLQNGEAIAVNDNGRYVLVEFPKHIMPPRYLDWLFELRLKGLTPIFTHPERHTVIQSNTDLLREWVHGGGLVQVTAMSVTGEFGRNTRKCAEALLKHHLVHAIASDAHSKSHRRPILSKALKAAKDITDPDYAEKLVNDFPEAIVNGIDFVIPEPLAEKRTFFDRVRGR